MGVEPGLTPPVCLRAELPDPFNTVAERSESRSSLADSALESASTGMAASEDRRESGLNID
jgi:hypothetical protein